MLGSRDAGPCTVGDGVRSGLRGTVTAHRAGLGAGVLGIRSTGPRTGGNRVIHILIGGVTAGTGYLSAMLGGVVGSVAAVGQRVACVLVGAVSAGRAGLGSAVLSSVVVRPASISEAVTFLCGRTNIGSTGGTVRTLGVLGRAVIAVFCGGGMGCVGI